MNFQTSSDPVENNDPFELQISTKVELRSPSPDAPSSQTRTSTGEGGSL